jgi:transcriptional regulator with XRE-family HTH domain
MTARDGRRQQACRRAIRAQAAVGEELRGARLSTGLSLESVGLAAGMSREKVRRIERGLAAGVSVADLVVVGAVVGLDVSIRCYPGDRPMRDIGYVRLLERCRARLHPTLAWQPETPIPIPGDRRAWDAVIRGPDFRIGVEAETRLGDAQALERRVALKARDSEMDRVLLLIADTRHNREVLRVIRASTLSAFPVPARSMLAALGEGRDPGGSGIVVL